MKGRVFDIQRFSIHDGPGIRTTVFLKGCPLHCKWCHNPEGINPAPQLSFLSDRCIACGECVKLCSEGALGRRGDGKAVIEWRRCTQCGECAKVCDARALEMVGREMSVGEVLEIVLRDRDYYRASGGGITASGGEPAFQPDFVVALLGEARRRGLHTVIETSGLADWEVFARLMPVVDLFLYDYKETDPRLHEAFIGQPNTLILANLRRLHGAGAKILLRCPMIPEYNARPEHWDGIAAISRELPNLQGVEVLPYHRLGRAKETRFGLMARMPLTLGPPDSDLVGSWLAYLRKRGVPLVNP